MWNKQTKPSILTNGTIADDAGYLLPTRPRRRTSAIAHAVVQAAFRLPVVGPRGGEVGEDVVDLDDAAAGCEVLFGTGEREEGPQLLAFTLCGYEGGKRRRRLS